MGRGFKEVAHLRTDKEKFDEGWDRIFGTKKTVDPDQLDLLQEKAEATAQEYHEEKKQEQKAEALRNENLFAQCGIDREWINKAYEEYSGDDKEDVNWKTERAGWEFIIEKVLMKVMSPPVKKVVRPQDGGCWFCHTRTSGMMFDCEFDTYVHRECLQKAFDEGHEEAQVMGYLLTVPEGEAQDE